MYWKHSWHNLSNPKFNPYSKCHPHKNEKWDKRTPNIRKNTGRTKRNKFRTTPQQMVKLN
jgi:hypothetical protein